MRISGTLVNYYFVCHRELWLFANGINMEHNSDLVYEGKLIHEDSYPQRSVKYEEVAIDGIKVDYYDARKKGLCKNCSYFEFCYSNEMEEDL